MIEQIKTLGISGSIGFLIGLGVVSFVNPEDAGAVALLIGIPVLACSALGGLIAFLRPGSKNDRGLYKGSRRRGRN